MTGQEARKDPDARLIEQALDSAMCGQWGKEHALSALAALVAERDAQAKLARENIDIGLEQFNRAEQVVAERDRYRDAITEALNYEPQAIGDTYWRDVLRAALAVSTP